jgi:DNA-binding transcriptional LysR family regulator
MNISSFDLNLLRVLDALLREGSTVRAGARVGLSQPAVSAALGRLRHALGDPLFIRHGQKLEATDYARTLEIPLRSLLDQLAGLLAGPQAFDPARAVETFRLSGSDFFAELLMPRLAGRLAKLAPDIRVQLVDLLPENYVGTLERYEVDMAFVPRTEFPEWIDHQSVFRSAFVTIARKGHPRLKRARVRAGGTIPVDLFCDLGHVLFSPEGRLKAMGDAALAAVGRQRRVVMTLPVFSGVARAVAQSDNIALVPQQLAEDMAPRLGLATYQPPIAIAPADICMIWHRRATGSPAHRWLRGLTAELLADLDRTGVPRVAPARRIR